MTDPFAQAIHDCHFDELAGPLLYRNGEETHEAAVAAVYLDEWEPDGEAGDWFESWLDGPLLDMGAGGGRHALYFQEQFETVAIDNSEPLVAVMRDRGVADARLGDMFALRESFERDRFRSALAVGTQLSLARSEAGVTEFLADLAYVTTPNATAVLDCFDPEHERTREMLDFYEDATPGRAYRVLQFEYDGTLGEPWLYRLFTPETLRELTVGTDWRVADVRRGSGEWDHNVNVALEKC